ncbi:hypothetical protein DACRYDRAFT_25100 [Dacryopinax primogenitus]|uniref:Uncharacterized protein n=1 Tax=Dacryopinax primogenitus (strain DJM 731) TaxID=1858805 RepID=M5FNE3_DACPD|nr:uncharacterized protein DACRYDRAFT_25100 [Dacryopinax primogenitus]EJT97295.1 hypothetical protein DACRYDRAFT_25100 [Dacryopinax primogenitus]
MFEFPAFPPDHEEHLEFLPLVQQPARSVYICEAGVQVHTGLYERYEGLDGVEGSCSTIAL